MRFVVVCALAAGCDPSAGPAQQQQSPPLVHDAGVAVAPDAAAPIRLVGVVTAAESVNIAPRFPGKIAKVAVSVGDSVTAGQVVAEMDKAQSKEDLVAANADVAGARAEVKQKEVELAAALNTVKRDRELFQKGIVATQELEDAEYGAQSAKAALQRARSTRDEKAARASTAKAAVAATKLIAESAGTVAIRYLDAGNTVEANKPIIKLVHGSMRIRFAIPLSHQKLFTVGGKVEATIDTVAAPVTATIVHVNAVVDPASEMVFADAELDDQSTKLRFGLPAGVGVLPLKPPK